MEHPDRVEAYTTALAVPGILLFWLMMRAGLIDASVGTAATETTAQPAA